MSHFTGPCTCVYWNVVDFPFPSGLDPRLIYQRIKVFLENRGFFAELSIIAYVDKETFPDELYDVYANAGITIIYPPRKGGKYDICRVMSLDIVWWEEGNHANSFKEVNLMVISQLSGEQSGFLNLLRQLADAGFKVLLAMRQLPQVLPEVLPKAKLESVSFDLLKAILLDSPVETMSVETMPVETMPVETMSDSPVETNFTGIRTCVFWDFHFPFDGVDARWVYHILISTLEEKGFLCGDLSIMVNGDLPPFPDDLSDAYAEVGISIIYSHRKVDHYSTADNRLVDILLWALANPANYFEPLNLVVISPHIKEETDFLNALEALGDRYYNVLVIGPALHLPSSELRTLSFDPFWTRILAGLIQTRTVSCLNHKLRSREEAVGFSDGLASISPPPFSWSEITVFWDVQDCLTGDTKISPVLRDKGYRGFVLIRPYADATYMDFEPLSVVDCDCGMSMYVEPLTRVVTNGNRNAKVMRMLLDLLFWAMNNDDVPQNFMLISKPDPMCYRVIEALEHRGFNLVLEPSDEMSLSRCRSPPDREMRINQLVKLQGRKLTEVSRKIGPAAVAVFCLLDEVSNPAMTNQIIKSTLEKKGYNDIISIKVYVDEGLFPNQLDCVKEFGLEVLHVPVEPRHSKIDRMAWDMISWTFSSYPPRNYLVIAKPFQDLVLDCLVDDFKSRGLNVLFELPDYVVTFGSSVWSAKSREKPLLGARCSAPIV